MGSITACGVPVTGITAARCTGYFSRAQREMLSMAEAGIGVHDIAEQFGVRTQTFYSYRKDDPHFDEYIADIIENRRKKERRSDRDIFDGPPESEQEMARRCRLLRVLRLCSTGLFSSGARPSLFRDSESFDSCGDIRE